MDPDAELDVTLSNGRRVVAYQIAALDARRRLDARMAPRLAAGWVPGVYADAPST
jgi:hypothetical protein